ncbi:hypothetical protein RGAI101_3461 [Roseobacter sp. GAI101]|jgi:hypothetical protein|nr:hypothetical protein RGAI101_3461 [Roseobacter sp. GAI101]
MALSDQFQFVRQRYQGDIMLTTRAIGSEGFGHEKMPCQRCQIFQIHENKAAHCAASL